MPITETTELNYRLMRQIRNKVKAQMIADNFTAGQFKFNSVLEKRTRKRYLIQSQVK